MEVGISSDKNISGYPPFSSTQKPMGDTSGSLAAINNEKNNNVQ